MKPFEANILPHVETMLADHKSALVQGTRFVFQGTLFNDDDVITFVEQELNRRLAEDDIPGIVRREQSSVFTGSGSNIKHYVRLEVLPTFYSLDVLTPAHIEYLRSEIPQLVDEIKKDGAEVIITLDKSARWFFRMVRSAWQDKSTFPTARFVNIGSEKVGLVEDYVIASQSALRSRVDVSMLKLFDEMIVGFEKGRAGEAGSAILESKSRKILIQLLSNLLTEDDFVLIFGLENIHELKRILKSCSGRNTIVLDDVVMSGKTQALALMLISMFGSPSQLSLRSVFKSDTKVFQDNPTKFTSYVPWSANGVFDGNTRQITDDSRDPCRFVTTPLTDLAQKNRVRKLQQEVGNIGF